MIVCGRPRSAFGRSLGDFTPWSWSSAARRSPPSHHPLKPKPRRAGRARRVYAGAAASLQPVRRAGSRDTPGHPTRRRHRREGADAGAPCRPATASGSTGSSACSTAPSQRRYGQSAYAENYVAINGPAVSDFLRAVTGVPDLVWSGSRPLAGRPGTERPSPSPTGSASPAGSAGTTLRKPAPRGSTGSSPTP